MGQQRNGIPGGGGAWKILGGGGMQEMSAITPYFLYGITFTFNTGKSHVFIFQYTVSCWDILQYRIIPIKGASPNKGTSVVRVRQYTKNWEIFPGFLNNKKCSISIQIQH